MDTIGLRTALYKAMQKRIAGVSVTEEWTSDGGVKRTTKLDDSTPGEADLLVRMLQVAPPGAEDNQAQGTPKGQGVGEVNPEVAPVEEVHADQAPAMQDEEDVVNVEPKDRIKASKKTAASEVPSMEDVDFDIEVEQDDTPMEDMSDPVADKEFHMGEAKKKADEISKLYTGPEMWPQMENEFTSAAEELDFDADEVASALLSKEFNDVKDDGTPIIISPEEALEVLEAGYNDDVPHKDINRRLDSGDVWAWCTVHVIAHWTNEEGQEFTGDDYLGGCSYASEADFKQPHGYYDDMKQVSYDALIKAVQEANMAKDRTASRLAFLLPKRVDCEFKVDEDPEQQEPPDDDKVETMEMLEEMDHVYERLQEQLNQRFANPAPLDNNYNKESLRADVADSLDMSDADTVSSIVADEVSKEVSAMGSVDITPALLLPLIKKAIEKDGREGDLLLASWESIAKYDSEMYEYFGKVTCTWTNPENEVEYVGESTIWSRGMEHYSYEAKQQSHEDEAFEDMISKIKKEIGESGQTEMPITAKKEKRYAMKKKEEAVPEKTASITFIPGDFVQVISGKMLEAGLEGSIGQISNVFEKVAEIEFADPDESLGMPIVARVPLDQLRRVEDF